MCLEYNKALDIDYGTGTLLSEWFNDSHLSYFLTEHNKLIYNEIHKCK